jgi:DHA1 family tetracycline resistance protein-like MFS transporter
MFFPVPALQRRRYGGGLLASIYAAMQFVFGPILGSLSDQIGRKPILLVSLLVMAFYYLAMGFAQTIWLLFVARIIGGITSATQPTASAYMADISKPSEKAARFGLLGAGFGMGFVLGPVLGGFLGEWGPRAPFFAAAALAALNAVMGIIILPESVTDNIRSNFNWRRANPFGALKTVAAFPGLRLFLTVTLLYGIATSVYAAIWPFFTVERFDWSPGMIGVSLTIYGVFFAIVQGGLVRPAIARFGETKTVIIGFCFELLAMIMLALVTNGILLLFLIPVASLGVIGQPALQAIMSQATPNDTQGTLQGVLGSLHSVSMVITPLTMTFVFSVFTAPTAPFYFPGAPFICSAILIGLCLIIFLRRSAQTVAPRTAGE